MPPQSTEAWGPVAIGIVIFVILIVLIIFGVLFQFMGLYVRAWVSGARVSLPAASIRVFPRNA